MKAPKRLVDITNEEFIIKNYERSTANITAVGTIRANKKHMSPLGNERESGRNILMKLKYGLLKADPTYGNDHQPSGTFALH